MTSKAIGLSPVATMAPGRRARFPRFYQNYSTPIARRGVVYNGQYRIYGTVAVAGNPDVPIVRLVGLFDKLTKRQVRAQISSASGNYAFDYVSVGPWIVLACDHTGEYNAVVADNIFGESM